MAVDSDASPAIVKAQKASNNNVITMQPMDKETRVSFLSYLGGDATPFMVMVYPRNFADKTAVISYLDAYNNGKAIKDQVVSY